MHNNKNSGQGFTLVEIAIVLVVIGLIVGGILMGQSLTRKAELQSIITDIGRFQQAIKNFKEKYGALPGDMSDAESQWGADAACPATPTNTTGKRATCNGSGNGLIGDTAGTYYEIYRAWQQLSNAGFIEGLYSGVTNGAGATISSPSINVPAGKIVNTGYTLRWVGTDAGAGDQFAGKYDHAIYYGAAVTNATTYGPMLTPIDAYSIDLKMDDGRPAYGNVLGWKSTAGAVPSCTTTAVSATSAYNVADDRLRCSLIFRTGF